MKKSITRDKLLNEIAKIPEEKLAYLYNFIHDYRLGLEAKKPNAQKIMQLAGSWNDMSEEDFSEFMNEIKERRSKAFSSRRKRETRID
ncbi:MAG: hypothetical protein GXO75_05525 [Calditrichaeota bacterium]|nr:hypothetical protein [Calditrichota bacterium]